MDTSSSSLQLTFVATLEGHKGWVTAIAAPADATKNFIVTASRGTYFSGFFCGSRWGWMDGCDKD
jgi:hypothetical protein